MKKPKPEAKQPIAAPEAKTPEPEKAPKQEPTKTTEPEKLPQKPEPEKSPESEKLPQKPEPPQPPEPEQEGPDEEELAAMQESERQRVVDMTRTVQVSIEQILARAAEQEAARAAEQEAAQAAAQEELERTVTETERRAAPPQDHEEEPPESLGRTIGRGAKRLGTWTLLVICCVLLIAGAGVAWLWNGASDFTLPQITVTLDGEELPAAAYSWEVPVIGNRFKRTYSETLRTSPYQLAAELEDTSPVLLVTPEEMNSELQVWDESGETVFTGTVTQFSRTVLPGSGSYQAELVLHEPEDRFMEGGSLSGSQTYQFAFSVNVRPTVRLNTQSGIQGSVVAVTVTNIADGDIPALECGLANCGFVKYSRGWVCYLPIPWDAEPGSYPLKIITESYEQTLTLAVRSAVFGYRDYSWSSQLTSPWISEQETPDEVRAVLDVCDPEIRWDDKGFVQPFVRSVTIKLPFGTTEYVGRSSAQRTSGGAGGRTAINAVVATRRGDALIAPAAGRVLLAEDLGGSAGKTVVVEHGAGLKSIFYGLASLNVEAGDTVVQGQSLGTTGSTVVAEARIGTVPVDGFAIWRNQCDATKTL